MMFRCASGRDHVLFDRREDPLSYLPRLLTALGLTLNPVRSIVLDNGRRRHSHLNGLPNDVAREFICGDAVGLWACDCIQALSIGWVGPPFLVYRGNHTERSSQHLVAFVHTPAHSASHVPSGSVPMGPLQSHLG
ncbi:MAG: hypothetical protein JWO80_3927 [Bryobacterales bacterium]|nr:hypothetical protein [Bryobacterales bacterium]